MGDVVVTGGGCEALMYESNQSQSVKISGRLRLTLVQVLTEASDY
jgi:hypothetical protein